MKKRIISVLLILSFVFSMLSAVSCSGCAGCTGGNDDPATTPVTLITLDINPSIEFIVGTDGKVAAVTAFNDEGSVLIAGEEFIGKTPEKAIELAVSLATDMGYLIKGDVSEGVNKIKMTVAAETSHAEKVKESIDGKLTEVLGSKGVTATVQATELLTAEALKGMFKDTTALTSEQLSAMTVDQLCTSLLAERKEAADFLTEALRDAYYWEKAKEVTLAKREQTALVIEAMGGVYTFVHTTYKNALDAYSAALSNLVSMRYNMLVSQNSAYQQALTALRTAKSDMIAKKNVMLALSNDVDRFADAYDQYLVSNDVYNAALSTLQDAKSAIEDTVYSFALALSEAERALETLETAFVENVKTEITSKAQQIENAVNSEMKAFLESYKAEHANDMSAIENALKAQKQQLIAAVATN